jgi:hypothetical protein
VIITGSAAVLAVRRCDDPPDNGYVVVAKVTCAIGPVVVAKIPLIRRPDGSHMFAMPRGRGARCAVTDTAILNFLKAEALRALGLDAAHPRPSPTPPLATASDTERTAA